MSLNLYNEQPTKVIPRDSTFLVNLAFMQLIPALADAHTPTLRTITLPSPNTAPYPYGTP